MRTSILLITAAAAALAGAAYAQQPPAPPPPGDPLGAATMTRAEAQTRAAAMFDRFDANHDGKLDQADKAARMGAMFDRIDTNHDGSISRDEFTAAHQRMGGAEHGGMARGKMGHDMMGHDMMGRGAARPPLSREAFVAEALKRFDAADANHDGKLSREERRTAWRAQRGMRRGHHGAPAGMDMPPPPPPPAG